MYYTCFISLYLSVFMIVILFYGVKLGVLVLIQIYYIYNNIIKLREWGRFRQLLSSQAFIFL